MTHHRLRSATEGLSRPCLGCGVLVEKPEPNNGARCWRCRNRHEYDYPHKRGERTDGLSASQRGYDARWQRLSRLARRMQPFCSDCGCPDDLTADHLRWPARTLKDVDVLCRPCNSSKGPVR